MVAILRADNLRVNECRFRSPRLRDMTLRPQAILGAWRYLQQRDTQQGLARSQLKPRAARSRSLRPNAPLEAWRSLHQRDTQQRLASRELKPRALRPKETPRTRRTLHQIDTEQGLLGRQGRLLARRRGFLLCSRRKGWMLATSSDKHARTSVKLHVENKSKGKEAIKAEARQAGE